MVWQGKEEEEMGGAKAFLNILKGEEMVDSVCFEGRESLLLGRHGNCDVLVAHPSISRQHLHIQLLPRSRKFILTDLDSVHGTVVNGQNLPPLSPLTAGENDSFQLGASSRVYTIQWKVEDKETQSPEPITRKASLERARKKESSEGVSLSLPTNQQNAHLKENFEEILRPITTTTLKPSNSEKRVPFAPLQQNKANARSSPGSPISAKKKKSRLPPLSTHKMKSETTTTIANKKEEGMIIMNAAAEQSEGERGGKQCRKPCLSSIEEEEEEEKEAAALLLAGNTSTLAVMEKEEEKQSEVMVIVSPPQSHPLLLPCPSANSYGSSSSSLTERRVLIEDSSSSIEKEKESAMELAAKIALPPHPPSTNSYGTSSSMDKKVLIEDSSEKEKGLTMELAVKIALPPHPPSNCYRTLSSTEKSLPKEEESSNAMEKEKEMEFIVKIAPPHPPTNSYGTSSSTEKIVSIEEDVIQILPPFCKDLAFDSRTEQREEEEEEYPSDKENLPPYPTLLTKGHEGLNNNNSSCEQLFRGPLQPLQLNLFRPSSPTLSYSVEGKNDDYCHGSFGFSEHSQQQTTSFVVAQNLDHMLKRLKLLDEVEALHRQWHIVIDTSCLIDTVSFESVKQLEGIKDTRLIIPKIVIWELDGMNRRKGSKSALEALKWIENCMVKVPFWIHVQNSAETSSTVVVGLTPPASPLHSSVSSGDYSIMSPTNHDLVLDCALLFSRSVMEGHMALLTNNTTLKIKTMSEGMITCESAQVFCESLLSPYSERFLWSQSTARGRYWIQRPNTKRATCCSSPTRKRLGKHHHHELKNHCSQGLLGLKVVLE